MGDNGRDLESTVAKSDDSRLAFETRSLLFDEALNCYVDPTTGRYCDAEAGDGSLSEKE